MWCVEATLFSAWIYDTLKPYAHRLAMGHPAKVKAITAGKKRSDLIDARTIAALRSVAHLLCVTAGTQGTLSGLKMALKGQGKSWLFGPGKGPAERVRFVGSGTNAEKKRQLVVDFRR